MNEDSSRTHRWDKLARSGHGFLPKTNPKANQKRHQDSELSARCQAGFPDRTNPDYGRTPLTSDQKELATRYLPLARSLARQLHARWSRVELDEVESVAFVALVEAARAFNPNAGTQFQTFLRYRIVGAIIDISRKAAKSRIHHASSMRDSAGGRLNFENCGTPVGITPDLPVGADVDAADAVEFHLRPMSPAQARACRLIYLEGKSREEAAVIMNCTASYISKIHTEAMDLLFNRLRNRGDRPILRSIAPADAADCPPQDAWCRPKALRSRSRMPRTRPLAMAAAC